MLQLLVGALAAYGEDLTAPDHLELLAKARDPARAARLTRAQASAALKHAGRRKITDRATAILAALGGEQLGQPPAVTAAYAATARSLIAVIITLNEQVKILQARVEADCGQHPDAEIYLSQPGLGRILGARVLAEFGDDPHRYRDGKAHRNYAATSPITRASGKRKLVAACFVHNARLVDALNAQAFASLRASEGARAFYNQQRANGHEHHGWVRWPGVHSSDELNQSFGSDFPVDPRKKIFIAENRTDHDRRLTIRMILHDEMFKFRKPGGCRDNGESPLFAVAEITLKPGYRPYTARDLHAGSEPSIKDSAGKPHSVILVENRGRHEQAIIDGLGCCLRPRIQCALLRPFSLRNTEISQPPCRLIPHH